MALPNIAKFMFLNYILVYIDYITVNIPFIGTVIYSFFTFYLVVCVISGMEKIASKLPFVSIHPLKYLFLLIKRPHDTLANSLLFNTSLFLIGTFIINWKDVLQWRSLRQMHSLLILHKVNLMVNKFELKKRNVQGCD
jgi:hypothetical protein